MENFTPFLNTSNGSQENVTFFVQFPFWQETLRLDAHNHHHPSQCNNYRPHTPCDYVKDQEAPQLVKFDPYVHFDFTDSS